MSDYTCTRHSDSEHDKREHEDKVIINVRNRDTIAESKATIDNDDDDDDHKPTHKIISVTSTKTQSQPSALVDEPIPEPQWKPQLLRFSQPAIPNLAGGLQTNMLIAYSIASIFWGLLLFDIVADAGGNAAGISASIGATLGLSTMTAVALYLQKKWGGGHDPNIH